MKTYSWGMARCVRRHWRLSLATGILLMQSASDAGAVTARCGKAPVAISILADAAELEASGACTVHVTVLPGVDAARAELVFEWESGEVTISGPVSVDLGALTAGDSYHASTQIRLTGKGDSVVRCGVVAYDAAGGRVYSRSRPLYIAAAHGGIATGDTSDVDVKLRLLERLRHEKRIEDAGYESAVAGIFSSPAAEEITITSGQKQGNLTLNMSMRWTDSAGATHIPRRVRVDILERNGADFTVIATDFAPIFNRVLDNNDPEGNGRDIAVRVYADGDHARVLAPGQIVPYSLLSSVSENVASGANVSIVLTANNTEAAHRAFSVMDAFDRIGESTAIFFAGPPAVSLPYTNVFFPITEPDSYFDPALRNLHIVRDDWLDWDVMHHEYGHYFTFVHNIAQSPGGSHDMSQNLGESIGKNDGILLAWDEGFATWFAIASQVEGIMTALRIPNVGDTAYEDTIDQAIKYDLELTQGGPSLGEDQEVSVSRTLYDLYDDGGLDPVSLGLFGTFIHAGRTGSKTLSQYWKALIQGAPMQEIEFYGCMFASNRVAPTLVTPEEVYTNAAVPHFSWRPHGAGPSNRLNLFTVQFWTTDFSRMVFESPEVTNPEWTPTPAQWTTIRGGAPLVKWVVRGRGMNAPETGPYISCARAINGANIAFVIDDTASMGQEIAGVASTLSAFIATLAGAGGTPPVISLFTFKDNVRSVITSSDLAAVQAAVSALVASGGGDCPEFSIQAIHLAARQVVKNGRVILATDANARRGSDIPTTISYLRGRGIRLDVLLSGACAEGGKMTEAAEAEDPSCNEPDCSGEEKTPPGCISGDCTFEGEPLASQYPTTATGVYSTIAAETGGMFAFVPEVNEGDTERFDNTALNMMLGVIYPTVVLAEPGRIPQGVRLNVLFRGANTSFNDESALSISGDGVTVHGGWALSATEYLADITVADTAATGARDVIITSNLGGGVEEAAGGAGVLTIRAAVAVPTIVGVQPPAGLLGETLEVMVYGAGTNFSTESTASFGGFGVTVNAFIAINPTLGVAQVTISNQNAALAFHDVIVRSGAEVALESGPGPFLVTTGSMGDFNPRILAIAPAFGAPGESLTVTITGADTNFLHAESAVAFGGKGITVTATRVNSATEAEADIEIALDAPAGIRDVVVSTGEEAAALLDGFLVTSDPPNQAPIADAGPDQTVTALGATINVTLDGSASTDPDGSIAAYAWSGAPAPAGVASPVVALGPGEHAFSLVVTDNEGARSSADTVIVTVEPAGAPDVEVTPSGTVQLGPVVAGSTDTATLTIRNAASGAVSGACNVSGAGFQITEGASFSLGAGEETTVTVQFSPPGKGVFHGTLTVTTAGGSPVSVSLVGRGMRSGVIACGVTGGRSDGVIEWLLTAATACCLIWASRHAVGQRK